MTLPSTSKLTRADGRVLRYCLYGRADGYPVIFHGGSPSSRWKWPTLVEAMRQSKLRLLVYDRPGYGGSTRLPGRRVADAVDDVRALADAFGWNRFAVFGGSGGGPHALACAALLAGRVTRCAVLSGIKPIGDGPGDEPALRSRLAEVAAEIMGRIEAGGPELLGVWRGTDDANVPAEHAEYLLTHIATAQAHVYGGGHLPGADVYREIYDWLHGGSERLGDR